MHVQNTYSLMFTWTSNRAVQMVDHSTKGSQGAHFMNIFIPLPQYNHLMQKEFKTICKQWTLEEEKTYLNGQELTFGGLKHHL